MNFPLRFPGGPSRRHSPGTLRSRLMVEVSLGALILVLAQNEASQPASGALLDSLTLAQRRSLRVPKTDRHWRARSPAGRDARAQSELRDAAIAMEVLYAFNENDYGGLSTGILPNFGYRRPRWMRLEVIDADDTGFRLKARAEGGTGSSWIYDSASGTVTAGD